MINLLERNEAESKGTAGKAAEMATHTSKSGLGNVWALKRIAPNGDVKRLMQETIQKLMQV